MTATLAENATVQRDSSDTDTREAIVEADAAVAAALREAEHFPDCPTLADTREETSAVNQCDGCRRGLPVNASGNHVDPTQSNPWERLVMACEKGRYVRAPRGDEQAMTCRDCEEQILRDAIAANKEQDPRRPEDDILLCFLENKLRAMESPGRRAPPTRGRT